MTLIPWTVRDVTVTATTIGLHFVAHPAIVVDLDTGETRLDAVTWVLAHRPSGLNAFELYQADPEEFPGEPRAIDLDRVEAFVEWLESRIDCSVTDLDFSDLGEIDGRTIADFRTDPNYFEVAAHTTDGTTP